MTASRQLDLFVAFVGDIPLRDDREAMSAPLVSLSKNRRTRIEWEGPSGQTVLVTAPEDYGIATVWDLDVILWAVSQLNAAVERGQKPPATISFRPYDLLRAVGRDTGGRGYAELKAALERLQRTTVETTIRRPKKDRIVAFNLLTDYVLDEDDASRPMGISITLPRWLHDAVVTKREVLAISPRYFDLTSGLDRFLYRLARRHAGKQTTGWRFSFKDLHGRSGSAQRYADFARDLRRAIARDCLPEYRLAETAGKGGPTLTMWRDPARCGMPQDPRLDWTVGPP